MKHWFLSDLHLKNLEERNGVILLRFFFYLNQNPSLHTVYFLGDIFDFWLSNGRAFQKQYEALIEQIALFTQSGGQLIYFEGNHDFHIDRYWTKNFGIRVIEDEATFNIDGLTVRCEHGDFINPDDESYLNYRAKVRTAWVEFIAHLLPGFFWKWLGETLSARSRKKTGTYAQINAEKITTMVRAYALKMYSYDPFDLIVTGHMHIFDDFEFSMKSQKKMRSINLGTWLEKPRLLLIENKNIQILDLEQFPF